MTTHNENLISFVVPFYNEGINVEHFHAAVTRATSDLTYAVEFVYVNDGSTDDTAERLHALHSSDPRVTVIDLAHNRGHQVAVTAGLDAAPGDAVIVMDADLQDPPPVALDLIAAWEAGADVAYAQRRSRRDTWFKRTTAAAYYRALAAVSDVELPRDAGDFRLLDRRVVDELKRYREHDRYLRGIVASLGFRQVAVPFDRDERRYGSTHYPLSKMVKLATDGLLGFSSFPLRAVTWTGAALATAGTVGLAGSVVRRRRPATVDPQAGVVLAGLGISAGIQGLLLGVLGGYVGRIYREVQNRPLYAVQTLAVARNRYESQPRLAPAA